MALGTYAQLQTAVASWLNRSDLTAVIPDMITLAETQFKDDFRWRKQLVRDIIEPPYADELFETLPTDFLEMKSIHFNTSPVTVPEYVTPTRIRDLQRQFQGAVGTPRYFTVVGSQLQFDRIPTGAPELEILHYVKIPSLSDAATTNDLLTEYPNIYLYGTLIQAEPYLKNDERMATWAALYANATDKLKLADLAAEMNSGPLIARSSRSIG